MVPMKQQELLIMCGFPASGKNVWISNFLKNHNHIVVELDEIRSEIFGHQFHKNIEPFVIQLAKSMVRLLLKQGKDVIINSTALTNSIRTEWINIGNEYNSITKIIYIPTNFPICCQRNSKRPLNKRVPNDVMIQMETKFETPFTSEYNKHQSFSSYIVIWP
jgi:predicted kinase